jgi:hypothetical protein
MGIYCGAPDVTIAISPFMRQLPARALPLAVRLLQGVLLVLILWFAAGALWKMITPAPVSIIPGGSLNATDAANSVSSAHLFGRAETPTGESAPPTSSNIVVRGLLAGQTKQTPVAILVVDNKPPVTVAEGAEIAPGMKLDRVYSDRIDVLTAYGRQTIALTK